ncbi:MAG: S41 family peptidase [Pirellulaceae bacterium]
MPQRNVLAIFIAVLVSVLCYFESGRSRYAAVLADAINTISDNYVEPIEPRELFESAMHGMVDQLDPYSGFMPPVDYTQFNQDMQQEFAGVGIEVGLEDGQLTVMNPLPGMPAFEAGVRSGDKIVAVDGTPTDGFRPDDAVGLIQGEIGTKVTLTVARANSPDTLDITIERARITVESIKGDRRDTNGNWIFTLEQDPQVGYIRIRSFSERTASELRDTLRSLNGNIDGLILDLRNNAGGLLLGAIEICDMFLPEGELIVSTKRRDAKPDPVFARETPIVPSDWKMVVLVDRFSASAAEIFAACLQDHQMAKVVGERSWGKGSVQTVIRMESGRSALRLTTASYWRPSGRNIHRFEGATEADEWGVTPDEGLTVTLDPETDTQRYLEMLQQRRLRDAIPNSPDEEYAPWNDPQLDKALDVVMEMLEDKN